MILQQQYTKNHHLMYWIMEVHLKVKQIWIFREYLYYLETDLEKVLRKQVDFYCTLHVPKMKINHQISALIFSNKFLIFHKYFVNFVNHYYTYVNNILIFIYSFYVYLRDSLFTIGIDVLKEPKKNHIYNSLKRIDNSHKSKKIT